MEHYITRRKVLSDACHAILKEMYMRAQPPADIDVYAECYKRGVLDKDKDRVYEWHYLPQEVQVQILDDYLEAYNANDQFKYWTENLLNLLKEGGYQTVYEDVFKTGEKVRSAKPTEKLDKIIGKESAEKVYDLINKFLDFYQLNGDELTLRGIVFNSPTTNPKTVKEKWKDIVIDDSVYKGYKDQDWDYTYKDYYDGEITGNIEED